MRLTINPGQPVSGDDFFGREKELEALKDKLSNGASIIIPGPRRWGKTSFFKEFFRRRMSDFKVFHINMHKVASLKAFCDTISDDRNISDPSAFLLEVRDGCKNMWNILADLLPNININDIKIEIGKFAESDDSQKLDSLTAIFKLFPKHKVVFVMDEISDFIIGLDEKDAIHFLKWLKILRSELNVQMILTGSVNITSVVKKIKVEYLIGDMHPLKLKPLKHDESRVFLMSLLKSKDIELKGEAIDFCNPKIQNGVHYFIQLFADEIASNCRNKTIDTKKEISDIYADLLAASIPAISDFNTRLSRPGYLTDVEQKAARKILANLADNTMNFDDLFAVTSSILSDNKAHLAEILYRLCDEGYLIEQNNNYCYISPILADYWLKHYYYEK